MAPLEDIFVNFTDGSALALGINIVSIVLVSISTAAVTRAVFVILRNSTIARARVGEVAYQKHFPVRERMLLGLFVSHLWTSTAFLVTLLVTLSHPSQRLSGPACDIQTIVTSTGVLTTHLWTIALAIVTYLALACPLGSMLPRVEQAWFGVGLWIYAAAIGLSAGLWKSSGTTYVGGYCDFGGDLWKYSELVNLIPRLIVFLTILSIYIHLHVLLRRGREEVRGVARTISRAYDQNPPSEQGGLPHGNLNDDSLRDPSDKSSISLWDSRSTNCRQFPAHDMSSIQPWDESMADFINRKARMLILLFPLSYAVLVIVSLAKLVYDATNSRPSVALHSVARWMLLLQGSLDALTYGWAGARLKQAARKLEEERAGKAVA